MTVHFWHNRYTGISYDLPKFDQVLLKNRQTICGKSFQALDKGIVGVYPLQRGNMWDEPKVQHRKVESNRMWWFLWGEKAWRELQGYKAAGTHEQDSERKRIAEGVRLGRNVWRAQPWVFDWFVRCTFTGWDSAKLRRE